MKFGKNSGFWREMRSILIQWEYYNLFNTSPGGQKIYSGESPAVTFRSVIIFMTGCPLYKACL